LSEWTGTYTFAECEVAAAAACGNVPHGGTRSQTYYQSATVPAGQTCVSEQRVQTCTNGAFGPLSGSFEYLSCTVDQVSERIASCRHNYVITGQFACVEYTNAYIAAGQPSCVGVPNFDNVSFVDAPCPRTNAVATCTLGTGGPAGVARNVWYPADLIAVPTLDMTCAIAGGTWDEL
jgi:hypothetical protein